MTAEPAHRWHPLTDLTTADEQLASAELPPLAAVWAEERERLGDDTALAAFNERLQREWAIETGVIERLYTLDEGTTKLLIEHGLDASLISSDATDKPPELVANLIQDQKQAVEWLFDFVAASRDLTTSFVKELHALMTRGQRTTTGIDQFGNTVEVPLRHGEYKDQPNNPTRSDGRVHEYCPPLQVDPEMERMVALHHEHMQREVAPEVEAAWLHHRFTQIHPFQDGNGRIARALGSLVFLRAGWFPLVITRDDRPQYLSALEAADAEDIGPLIALFAARQRKAFVGALQIAREVAGEAERVDQLIASIGEMFEQRDAPPRQELERAKSTAAQLHITAHEKFQELQRDLAEAIYQPGRDRHVFADQARADDEDRRTWHRWQILQTASALDYFADIAEYSSWVRLCIDTESGRGEILLSFHSIGREYRGLVGASLTFFRRHESADGERHASDPQPASDELFQINYKEEPAAVQARFGHWLERALVRALEAWRRGE